MHIDDDKHRVLEYLCGQTKQVIGQDVSHAIHKVIHAWRYANCAKQQGQAYFIDRTQQIAAIGDWCIQGRIEAAFSSGYALTQEL